MKQLSIGDTVYHRSIYEHKEPMKVVGLTETHVQLEGDYSGGTHNVCQRDWLPIKGTSRIYNHAFKERARNDAINTFVDAVMVLTNDVTLNSEF